MINELKNKKSIYLGYASFKVMDALFTKSSHYPIDTQNGKHTLVYTIVCISKTSYLNIL